MNCPSCSAKLDQDFGMVTCGSCKAVLMIDISGQIQMGSDQPPPVEEEVFENSFVSDENDLTESEPIIEEPNFDDHHSVQADGFADNDDFNNEESILDQGDEDAAFADDSEASFTEGDGDFEEVADNEFFESREEVVAEGAEEFEDSQFEEPQADSAEEIVEESSEVSAQFDDADEDEDSESFPMASEPDPNPVDISDFANSEESNLEDGELVYDVFVGRIDSKDQRDSLKYVLLDEKLKLNHHEFMKKIKNGEVVIPDLNPIKAKRIVEQLQFSDLDIKWKQKRVIIETVEPEIEEGPEEEDFAEDAEL